MKTLKTAFTDRGIHFEPLPHETHNGKLYAVWRVTLLESRNNFEERSVISVEASKAKTRATLSALLDDWRGLYNHCWLSYKGQTVVAYAPRFNEWAFKDSHGFFGIESPEREAADYIRRYGKERAKAHAAQRLDEMLFNYDWSSEDEEYFKQHYASVINAVDEFEVL